MKLMTMKSCTYLKIKFHSNITTPTKYKLNGTIWNLYILRTSGLVNLYLIFLTKFYIILSFINPL